MTVSMEVQKRLFPHRLTLKMLPRRAAELYLDDHLPDLDGEDREYALSLAGQHIPQPVKAKPQDALFCAAMFQAGVSLGDLAKLFGIKKPTVHQKIGRKLNDAERQQRDRLDALDPEVLALCLSTFNTALSVDPQCFDQQYPRDIGRALLSSSIAVVKADRGDETGNAVRVDPSRPRRYSNANISEPSGKDVAAELVQRVSEQPPAQPNTVRPEEKEWLDTL